MNTEKTEKLRKALSDALDLLWVENGNGFATEKQFLIAEIQQELERIESPNVEVIDGVKRTAADVESEVCEDIKARQRKGIAKYGTTVAANPLSQREWLQHAYEEALDLAIYLRKLIDGTEPPNA